MPGSFLLPVYLFPAGILIALVYLGKLPTLVYSAFLLGLFFVNQLVKRLGMVWTGVSLLYCWGFDRDLFGLSGHHKPLKGYQLLQQFIYSEMVSLLPPIFIYISYLYDHFMQ